MRQKQIFKDYFFTKDILKKVNSSRYLSKDAF